MQSTGDHQMQHEPQIVVNTDGNAFANAAQFADEAALHARKRWLHGAEQKRAGQAHSQNGLPDYAWFQGSEIGHNIGQLGHVD